MRKFIAHILLMWMMSMVGTLSAQQPGIRPDMQGGSIKGIVWDSSAKTPVEYATVSVFRKADSSLVNGTITNAKGVFQVEKLRPGKYFLEISFIGYHKKKIKEVVITRGNRQVDLGKLQLKQAAESLGEVVVVSERAPVQYKIDKKVVPVSGQHTAASGTAVDVLENVPSVSVDIEGNVSMRGNSGFTVLIDGRPTVLESNDALQQMPASAIENIEIITNPSAKYDPEGTAGIINIITKKGKLKGMSGLVNANVGTQDNYGGDFLWNYRRKKMNYYIGADYNPRNFSGSKEEENITQVDDRTSYVNSMGDMERNFKRYGVRGGIDFQIDSSNMMSLGVRYGGRSMNMGSLLDYEEWMEGDDQHRKSFSDQNWKKEMDFFSGNFNYQHNFKKKGHQLVGELSYSHREGDEESYNRLFAEDIQISGKKAVESGPASRCRWKVDYTLPLLGTNKFEAGYQGQYRSSDDKNKLYQFNPTAAPNTDPYDFQPKFSHSVTYEQKVHSLYSLYAAQSGALSYQLGLRAEYTYRNTQLKDDGSRFNIDRWDFFPTLHISLDINEENQFMTSYTRRIKRPRSYYLEPFITWTDTYNVRQGNPGLKPEYIDSYELGYLKRFGQHMLSVEGYYRLTHNKIERTRRPYQDNVMLGTFENVGQDYSLGVETLLSLQLFRWWKSDIVGNLYNYKQEGKLSGKDFSKESVNWSVRNNNSFKIDNTTRLQFTLRYNSPTEWAQGRREGYFTTNAALRKDFLKRKLSTTLQVRDIFSTSKHETFYEGERFYTHSLMNPKTPMVMLNISFKINNYKVDRKKSRGENGEEDDFEM